MGNFGLPQMGSNIPSGHKELYKNSMLQLTQDEITNGYWIWLQDGSFKIRESLDDALLFVANFSFKVWSKEYEKDESHHAD